LRILLLDDDTNIEGLLKNFLEIENEWSLIKSTAYHSNIDNYPDNNIDLIIADTSKKLFNDSLNKIIAKNKTKKTIIISDEIKSNINPNCDYCQENYNRKRLFKPTSSKELYNLIKYDDESSCLYINRLDSPKKILSTIIKRFSYFDYDELKEIIYSSQVNTNNRYTYEFISIVSLLEKNDIPFKILDEYQIKIL